MPRRLWIFNHYAGFPETVPASRTFELSRCLAKNGWDVTVIAAGFNHYSFKEDWEYGGCWLHDTTREGVRWVFLRTVPYRGNGLRRLANLVSYAWRARRWAWAQQAGPDGVIGTTVHPLAAEAARVIAKRRGARFFYEVTDLWPRTLADLAAMSERSLAYRYLACLERRALLSADGVIGLLPLIDRYAAETYGVTVRRFCYAPNGVAEAHIRPPSGDRVESGRIVWAGGFGAAHGMDGVVEAAARLEQTHPGAFRFDLYGDGPQRARLERAVADADLRNVRFCGWVEKSEMGRALASAEICLCTGRPMSVHRYGISFNKLFDYFAAAKPIVFAVDAGNDPVAEAGAGLSVPAGDGARLAEAILRLHLLPPSERATLGARGREFLLREHMFDRIADRLDTFLAEALDDWPRATDVGPDRAADA